MSVQTLVLFGSRLYDEPTYSANNDPESLTATLSDSMTMTDSEKQSAIKVIADAISMADAWKTSGNKVLSDSTTMTDTIAKALIMHTLTDVVSMTDTRTLAAIKALSEALAIADTIRVTGTKGLSDSLTLVEQRLMSAVKILLDTLTVADLTVKLLPNRGLSEFIRLKDWLELKLLRANIWQSTPAYGLHPSALHLYGPGVYYGFDYYSSNPTVTWLLETRNTTVWQAQAFTVAEQSLYAQTFYGQSPFSTSGQTGWTKPIADTQPTWVNFNGESHN